MKSMPQKLLKVFILLLLPVGIAAAIFFYLQSRIQTKVSGINTQKDIVDTVKTVAKLIQLPQNEAPTLATVTDKTKLQDQEFFRSAENGDKVLIYKEAKKAILFRPSLGKIIDVAPVQTVEQNQQTPVVEKMASFSAAITATPNPVPVSLYNGTDATGVTYRIEQSLKAKVAVTVQSRQEAVKKDYPRTLVISVTGKQSEIAKEIATALNAELVQTLPEGEAAPPTDLLIIIGADKK